MNVRNVALSDLGKALGVVVLLVVLGAFGVSAVPQAVGAEHSYVVQSSSMHPTIRAGSVVLVNEVPATSVNEDDVITFRPAPRSSANTDTPDRVTHRVVGVVRKNGQRYYRTKGDANEEVDPWLLPANDQTIIGSVMFSIPFAGYVVAFVNTDLGILAFLIVPAVLLILNELWTLYRDAIDT